MPAPTLDPVAPDAAPIAEFLQTFAAMHAAMRRDAARLTTALAGPGPEPSPALRAWWDRFAAVIVRHHEREDTIVWPELLRRDPGFAAESVVLEADHAELDEAMAAVGAALAGDGRAGAARAAGTFATVLTDHLAREEAAAFPRLTACFTAEEWAEIEHRLSEGTPLPHLAFELPWVLDGMDAELRAVARTMLPAPVRALNALVFAPRYRRIVRPLVEGLR
jgi:iron-sulfur cluster repair protein YtfE (RIC family)